MRGKKQTMRLQDYFKNSVWESFTSSQGLTMDTATQILVSMLIALLMGLIIYKI